MSRPVAIELSVVVAAVTDEVPRVLLVGAGGGGESLALPSGRLDTDDDRTLEEGVRRLLAEQAGMAVGYVEQLYTFGDRERTPPPQPRVLSVAYLALVREAAPAPQLPAGWVDCYELFPWEDWRDQAPAVLDAAIRPRLARWVAAAGEAVTRRRREERVDTVFGLSGAPWDAERVLERYELLYEAGLVAESRRDRPTVVALPATEAGDHTAGGGDGAVVGRALALDHRRIVATALGRLRGKIRYRPVVFELLPDEFTLFQLQRVVEALAGVRLHKQNFRRLVLHGGLVEPTGRTEEHTGGRPAELHRFRREVLRERPAPGVGLPRLG